eukprot:245005_1
MVGDHVSFMCPSSYRDLTSFGSSQVAMVFACIVFLINDFSEKSVFRFHTITVYPQKRIQSFFVAMASSKKRSSSEAEFNDSNPRPLKRSRIVKSSSRVRKHRASKTIWTKATVTKNDIRTHFELD